MSKIKRINKDFALKNDFEIKVKRQYDKVIDRLALYYGMQSRHVNELKEEILMALAEERRFGVREGRHRGGRR